MAVGTLTGKTIASTYTSVLKLGTNLAGSGAAALTVLEDDTQKVVEDGNGNNSSLALATNRATITLGETSGDDFLITNSSTGNSILVASGDENRVGINTNAPTVNLDVRGTFNVGVDDTGHDVKFFGATSGAYMLWDESQDDLIIGGVGRVGIGTTLPASALDVAGSTGAELTMTRFANTIVDGNTIGNIIWRMVDGDGATDSDNCAMIQVNAGETHDTNNFGADMVFYTADNTSSSLSPRMTILDSGNVGIGTSSPGAKLDISATNTTGYGLKVERDLASGSTNAQLVYFNNTNTGDDQDCLYVNNDGGGACAHFSNDGSVIMQVGASGSANVGIGTASPGIINSQDIDGGGSGGMLHLKSAVPQVIFEDTAISSTDKNFKIWVDGTNGLRWSTIQNDNGTIVDEMLMAPAGLISGDFNDTSDVLLKKDISTISNGLSIINQLKPRDFTWKRENRKSKGFIAQELEKVLPDLVNGEDAKKEYQSGKSIKVAGIVAVLTKAIQELSAKVEALESK